MKIIVIEDKNGGYTGYVENMTELNIIVEGETHEEIRESLTNVYNDIIMSLEIEEYKLDSNS